MPRSRSWYGTSVSLHKDQVTWAGALDVGFINGKTRVALEATPLFKGLWHCLWNSVMLQKQVKWL